MSNLYTLLGRLVDQLILVSSLDTMTQDGSQDYKNQAKKILKTLQPTSPSRCTIDAGPYFYHYLIESEVVYLCMTSKGYPKALAFQYLEDVQKDFSKRHGNDVRTYSRPYQAVAFQPALDKLKRDYADPSRANGLRQLSTDLQAIHNIMSSNINEVLQRGEKLDVMETRSSALVSESKKFQRASQYANLQALYKTYGPLVAIALIVLVVLYLRFR